MTSLEKELNAIVKYFPDQEFETVLPPQLSDLLEFGELNLPPFTLRGQFDGGIMALKTESNYKFFKDSVAKSKSQSYTIFAVINLPLDISEKKGEYVRTQAFISFNSYSRFDKAFMDKIQEELKASLTRKTEASPAKKASSGKPRRDQYEEQQYTAYFKKQNNVLVPLAAEELSNKIESIVFVKCFNYTSFTFSSLLDDRLIFPNFTLNDILNSKPGQITLPHLSSTERNEALERVASTFNMNYIVGLIVDYLGLFQTTLDTSRLDNEADRRVIINIFLMVASAMASLAFSVEVNLKSNIQEKRLGNGPLDYFLQPQEAEIRSDIKAKLFNQPSSASLSSIAKMSDLTSQVVIQIGAPPTEEQLMELQEEEEEEEEEEEDIGHIVYEGGEQVQEVYVAPSSSDQATVVKARPLSILEAKSDCLMISGNLDHSLGQLLAQMIDAMKVPEVKRKQSKYLWIKGLLSTGQRTLFFSMRKDKDSEHSLPEVFYHGQVVIQVLPFISNRTSGHNMDENLTIRSEQVLAMIKNLYVFLTTDMETSSSEESMKTVKKAETDP